MKGDLAWIYGLDGRYWVPFSPLVSLDLTLFAIGAVHFYDYTMSTNLTRERFQGSMGAILVHRCLCILIAISESLAILNLLLCKQIRAMLVVLRS